MRLVRLGCAVACAAVAATAAAQESVPGGAAGDRTGAESRRSWGLDASRSLTDFKVDLEGGRYPTHVAERPPSRRTVSSLIAVGFYRRGGLKTEIEYGTLVASSVQGARQTDGVRSDIYDRLTVATPSFTDEVTVRHNYEVTRLSVGQVLQFRPHRVLRPYVGVTFGLDRETHYDDRIDSIGAAMSEVERAAAIGAGLAVAADPYPAAFPRRTKAHLHVAARIGAKVYIPRRVFVLVEAAAGTRTGPGRLGLGIDVFD
jgi:hypothetical protein